MATYVNDLRLKEIATGDEAGTWGTSTNTNLELIAEAFSYGTEAITTNADTHTTTIADGSTDPGRSLYLKYTGTLDSACTITLGPNTVSKMWFIENATTGSQNIIISQGSGANVTIPAGETKVVYSDGAGAGAAITDAFASLKVSDAAQTNITSVGALDGGSITSGFGSIDVGSSAITTTGTVTGNTLAGTLSTAAQPNITSLGTLTTLTVDDITINGSTISDAGDLTLDVGGDIILDADGGDIFFKDAGVTKGTIQNTSDDLVIKVNTQDKDLLFKGNDGGSGITALTLDMSDAGAATFNNTITAGANSGVIKEIGSDLSLVQGAVGLRINDAASAISPTTASANNDAAVDLGVSNIRFKRLYLSDGITDSGQAGSNTVFNEDGTTADFRVESNGNANMLFVNGGTDAVSIGTSTNYGGVLNVESPDNGATLILISTDADASEGPLLDIRRESASPADNDLIGSIRFRGDNDADQNVTYTQIKNYILDASDGTEDGQYNIETMVAGSLQTRMLINNTSVVFNESSIDSDFRVESNNKDHMFFVDGGNDRIGINTSSPTNTLHILNEVSSDTIDENNGLVKMQSSGGNGMIFGTIASSPFTSYIQSAYVQDTSLAQYNLTLNPIGGSVGIGTSNPTFGSGSGLEIEKSGTTTLRLQDSTSKSFEMRMSSNLEMICMNSSSNIILDPTANTLFKVNGAEKGRFTTNGLTFNGDTAAANALDDYEEGTWTPTYAGQSTAGTYNYGSQLGTYTKVGRTVTITATMSAIQTVTAGVGTANIKGLPFSVNSTHGGFGSVVLEYFDIDNNTNSLACEAVAGTTFIRFWETVDSAANSVLDVTDKTNNSADIFVTITYQTS